MSVVEKAEQSLNALKEWICVSGCKAHLDSISEDELQRFFEWAMATAVYRCSQPDIIHAFRGFVFALKMTRGNE